MRQHFLSLCVMALLPLTGSYSTAASAGIILNVTRIILGEDERNASTVLSNITKNDYAVQIWVNDQADSDKSQAPFIAMPAIFRVRAGQEQVVRVIKTPGVLPADRESVFYFNAQEIPLARKGEDNSLKLAIRTRVKFFYRPKSLTTTSAEAPSQLKWTWVNQGAGSVIRITNNSPYHITFGGVSVIADGKITPLTNIEMIAPLSVMDYPLGSSPISAGATVEYAVINDYGGYSEVFKVRMLP